MNYLGIPEQELERLGGYWTAREISQQPEIWHSVAELLGKESARLHDFLEPLLCRPSLRIVLTGAGTSAFIGDCLAPALMRRRPGLRIDALATTDIVASPESTLAAGVPTLLVSFARSGNSPESVGATDLAERCVDECHHLVFTCNRGGALSQQAGRLRNALVVHLPEETNDRGFAMTSSFSGMLLAAALAFDLKLSQAEATATLAGSAKQMLGAGLSAAQVLGDSGFTRVVYLGSNECKGLAREAALKMLELSDGRVVATSESPLGFRHGPKTFVNADTLVVMFLSNNAYTRRYELDLLDELRADAVTGRIVVLTADVGQVSDPRDTISVSGASTASDLGLCFPYVVFAQTLALLRSLALGLRPDTPNASGTVNRVVQGVSIYPWSSAG